MKIFLNVFWKPSQKDPSFQQGSFAKHFWRGIRIAASLARVLAQLLYWSEAGNHKLCLHLHWVAILQAWCCLWEDWYSVFYPCSCRLQDSCKQAMGWTRQSDLHSAPRFPSSSKWLKEKGKPNMHRHDCTWYKVIWDGFTLNTSRRKLRIRLFVLFLGTQAGLSYRSPW